MRRAFGILLLAAAPAGCAYLEQVGVQSEYRRLRDEAPRLWLSKHLLEWDPLESTCRHASLSIL